MKVSDLFNNEAIATVALGTFFKIHKKVDFATVLVILPLLLHEPTVKRLNSRAYKRSMEEFIVQYPDLLVGFNSRFKGFLPLSINAITILNEAGVIEIGKNIISFNNSINFNPHNAGNRFEKINKATLVLSDLLLQETTSSLFLKLKVEL